MTAKLEYLNYRKTRFLWISHLTNSCNKRVKFTMVQESRHRELPVSSWQTRTSKMKQCKSKTSKKCSMLRTLSISRWIRSMIRDGLRTSQRKQIKTSWDNILCQNMLRRDGSTRVNSSQMKAERSSLGANSQTQRPHWYQKSADLLTTSLTLMRKKKQKRSEIKQWNHRHRKSSLKCNRKKWNAFCKVKRV